MPKRTAASLLNQLNDLAADPLAQSRFAAELLVSERRAQLLGPALAALEQTPLPTSRPALLGLYADLDADGIRLDAGGSFRAAILRALRPWINSSDTALLERAVGTYEFLPPGRSEEAGAIRAAGLLALADTDPQLAGFHAARLLVDRRHTSELSGEPGRTAASVLAALSEHVALYMYTLRDEQRDDVTAECLRHLGDAPDSIVHSLCQRYDLNASETTQIGLLDLLLSRPQRQFCREELQRRLQAPLRLIVLRYLATAIVASRDRELIEALQTMAQAEQDPARRVAVDEALALLPAEHAAARSRRVRFSA